MKVTLCTTCVLGTGRFAARLQAGLPANAKGATIAFTDCMSGCARASTLSVREAGKTAYLFGDLTEADLPDLLVFLRLYAESPDGSFADARVLGQLRNKAIARIPG